MSSPHPLPLHDPSVQSQNALDEYPRVAASTPFCLVSPSEAKQTLTPPTEVVTAWLESQYPQNTAPRALRSPGMLWEGGGESWGSILFLPRCLMGAPRGSMTEPQGPRSMVIRKHCVFAACVEPSAGGLIT